MGKLKVYLKEHEARWVAIGTVAAMFTWGLSWPAGKILSAHGSAISIAFIRYMVIFISMFFILCIFRVPIKIKLNGLKFLIPAAICLAFYNFVFLKGLQAGFAGAGGVLVTTMNPIFAYSIGLLISRKIPGKNEVIGLVLGLCAGIFQLNLWHSVDKIFEAGNLYFLAGALVWAIMSKFTSRAGYYGNSFAFSLWMYLTTFIFFFIPVDLSEIHAIWIKTDIYFWLVMLFFGMGATSIATSFYFFATTRLGAERASSFIFLVPVSAAFSSYAFLGEVIQWHTIFGGLLGIIAVYMINRKIGPLKD
jgi:drug/metabolite transporter (DMT)-like permease